MKTKTIFNAVALVAILLPMALFAQQSDSVKTDVVVMKIDESFSKIATKGSFTLILQQAADPSIAYDRSISDAIQFKIRDGVLIVSSEGGRDAKNSKVLLKVKEISSIQSNDASLVETQGVYKGALLNIVSNDASIQKLALDVADLTVNANDASRVSLAGKALNFKLVAEDASRADAKYLYAANVTVTTHDVATAWVNGQETVTGVTNDVSKLYFYGGAKTVNIESKDVSRAKKFERVEDATEEIVVEKGLSDTITAPALQGDSLSQYITDILVHVDSTLSTMDKPKYVGRWPRNLVHKNRFDGNWGGFMIGFNNYLNSSNRNEVPVGYEFLEADLAKSHTFALNLFEYNIPLLCNKVGLTTGLGVQWYNYRFANNALLQANQPMVNGSLDTLNASDYKKSRLSYTMLNIPLLLEFQTNPNHNRNSFHINAGVILGIKLCSHTKMIIDDGAKSKIKVYDDFNLNPIRLDATAGIGYGKINLFASYALGKLFKEDEGPNLYPVTAGIYLVLW